MIMLIIITISGSICDKTAWHATLSRHHQRPPAAGQTAAAVDSGGRCKWRTKSAGYGAKKDDILDAARRAQTAARQKRANKWRRGQRRRTAADQAAEEKAQHATE